ncbi:MAG: sensor histidine kinase [Oligoflexales bacterium]|nr:sensor histidine kinase [Oligoflexales bacterium]
MRRISKKYLYFSLMLSAVLLLILLLIVSSSSKSSQIMPKIENEKVTFLSSRQLEEKHNLGRTAEYIEDPLNKLTIDDVNSSTSEALWRKSDKDTPGFGFSSSTFWFRLKIGNDYEKEKEFLVEIGYPLLNEIEFYSKDSQDRFKIHKAGSLLPFSMREYDYINFIFPVNIKPGEINTFYFKANSSSSLQFPITLWPVKRFSIEKRNEYAAHFFYNGIICVMICYNLFLWITSRNRNYLFYVLYISGFFILQSTLSGLAFQYFWPNYPFLTTKLLSFSVGFAIFWIIVFSMNFLNIKNVSRVFHRLSFLFIAWCVFLMGISFLLPYKICGRITSSLVITSTPYLAVMGAYCFFKGENSARYYLIAFFCLFAGAFIAAARMFGLIPINFLTFYGFQIGSAIEMVLLSLAVGTKFINDQNRIQREINDLNANLENRIREKIDELRNANIRLTELDRQKTQFFQNISHEIRTPLTLIMTPLEEALKAAPEDVGLQIASKNSNRLLRLVNQLLDFQKLSAAKKEILLTPIRISEFLQTCGAYFIPSCATRNIRFFLDIGDDKDLIILGQIDALEKILFNYLSNALKYTPPGGMIELIQTVVNDKVIISVKDEGPGISVEDKSKLFSVFSQVEGTYQKGMDGTGLGLALVKELTEAMNGHVFVR